MTGDFGERAEDAFAYVPRPASAVELARDEYVLSHLPVPAPIFGVAQRLRLAPAAVERAVRDVRAWFAQRGRSQFQWWVGGHARPPDLYDRLRGFGATPEEDGHLEVMVLEHEPPPVAGVVVRSIETAADWDTQREIRFDAFGGFSDEAKEAARARSAHAWREYRENPAAEQLLAFVDDEPVAAAGVLFARTGVALLIGGATLEQARGRGAFRALVRARWELAHRHGATTVAVHAGRMSQPILARLGFRTVSTLDQLRDDAGA